MLGLFGNQFSLSGQLRLKLLKFKQALNLEILGTYDSFAVLLDNIDVGEQTLNNLLKAGILDFKYWGVFKQRERTTCFEDVFYDVYHPLHWDILACQRVPLSYVEVTIYNPVDNAVSLCEEVNVEGRVDISQKVLVDRNQQLHILVVIHRAPNRAQFSVNVRQVASILQLKERFTRRDWLLTNYWMIKFAKGCYCC